MYRFPNACRVRNYRTGLLLAFDRQTRSTECFRNAERQSAKFRPMQLRQMREQRILKSQLHAFCVAGKPLSLSICMCEDMMMTVVNNRSFCQQ